MLPKPVSPGLVPSFVCDSTGTHWHVPPAPQTPTKIPPVRSNTSQPVVHCFPWLVGNHWGPLLGHSRPHHHTLLSYCTPTSLCFPVRSTRPETLTHRQTGNEKELESDPDSCMHALWPGDGLAAIVSLALLICQMCMKTIEPTPLGCWDNDIWEHVENTWLEPDSINSSYDDYW